MKKGKPTYKELETKIKETKEIIDALQNGQADVVISNEKVLVLRLKEAEDALRESEYRFREFFKTLSVGVVFQTPPDGEIIDVNPAAESLLGMSRDELIGLKPSDSRWQAVDDDGAAHDIEDNPALEALKTGRVIRGRVIGVYQPKQEQRRWLQIDAVPQFLPGADTSHMVCAVFTDITDRKLAEDSLRDLNETLEHRILERTAEVRDQSDRLRALASELSRAEQRERKRLAMVLHDSIQPLIVAARMQLWEIKRKSESQKPVAMKIEEILTEALTALRSLSVDLVPPELQHGGLMSGLKWLAAQMREKNDFIINTMLDKKLEPAAEETRFLLFECVRELLLNTVKHSSVKEAEVLAAEGPDNCIRLIISDRGKGFDPAVLKQNRSNQMTFGLFSIQERLAHIGGHMEIETGPDKGTKVILTAPLSDSTAGAPETHCEAPDGGQDGGGIELRRKRDLIEVLIVDDHKVLREGLVRLLKFESGIEVAGEASDGEQAIRMADTLKPDIIIMDVNLGGIDGVEATRRILAQNPHIKVIGLSMHMDRHTADAMRNAGASAYLTKGDPSEELIATIHDCAAA